jgi:hypothetical protein
MAFDYNGITPEDRDRLVANKDAVYEKGLTATVEIGNILLASQLILANYHGGSFVSWIETEMPFGVSQAYRLMDVSRIFPEISHNGKSIDVTALYELAAKSTPVEVRDEFIAKAKLGERVRSSDVRARLDELKYPQHQPVAELEDDDEDDWHEPPPLFSIVDTDTGEIIADVADLAAVRTAKIEADRRDFVDSLPSESKAVLVEMERATLPEIASEQIVAWFRRARLAQHEFERIDPTRLRTIATDRPDVADLLKEGIEVGMSLIAACRRGLPEDGQAIRRLS